MKIAKIFVCIFCVFFFTKPVEAAFWDFFFSSEVKPEPKTIKVLIVHDKPGVVLEVRGKYALYDPNPNRVTHKPKHIASRFLGKRKFIQAVSDGIRWGEVFPGIFQLMILPEEKEMTTVVDGISYRGTVYVYHIQETGTLSIVNEVLLDDYLNSVLSHKYTEKLSEEAAAAVAIAARTNALYYAENPKSPFWSVDANDVGYVGQSIVRETNPIVLAIENTKQMVMSLSKNSESRLPFPAEWLNLHAEPNVHGKVAKISLQEVEKLADKGDHAAEILKKAYPQASIQLVD